MLPDFVYINTVMDWSYGDDYIENYIIDFCRADERPRLFLTTINTVTRG